MKKNDSNTRRFRFPSGVPLALFLSLLLPRLSTAQTTVSGLIDTNTTWGTQGSPYLISGNTLVAAGATLSINPGVVVKFNAHTLLQVNGELIARGTPDSLIVFTANTLTPVPGYWKGLYLANAAPAKYAVDSSYQSGTAIEYATIEYGGGESAGGALQSVSSNPFINRVTVKASKSSGIAIIGGALVTHCTLENNGAHGLFATNYPATIAKNNVMRANTFSGIIFQGASGLIEGNLVTRNGDVGIRGYCGGSGFSVTRNIVYNNIGGMSLDGCVMSVTRNIVVANRSLDTNSAGGITLMDDGSLASYNIIANNTGLAYQGKGYTMGNLVHSLIYKNVSTSYVVSLASYATGKDFSYNTLVANTARRGVFIEKGCCGGPNLLSHNNISNTVLSTRS